MEFIKKIFSGNLSIKGKIFASISLSWMIFVGYLIWWNGRVETVFLEDYAYAATGRVFHIAENAGILKYKLKNFKTQYPK